MLQDYFKIIRTALQECRQKGDVYYEAHHIIPQSFKKKSILVLLTPEEHYECHRLLAEIFKQHPVYGQKMLWAFHRLAYDGKRKLTAEQYSEARKILIPLWKRTKTPEHREKLSEAKKGSKNPNYKGKYNYGRVHSQETKTKIGKKIKDKLLGKIGLESRASKGIVIYENESTGEKIEAGSALQVALLAKLSPSSVAFRLKTHSNKVIKGWKVYYKILT